MRWLVVLFLCCVSGAIAAQNVVDSKGKKQGAWSKTYPGTKVYQYKGQFKDDKPVGTFTYFYPNTKVKAIIKHSETSNRSEAFFYHDNGKLMSYGIYRDMKKDSLWLNFGPSGRISNSENYKSDLLDGKKTIYYVPEDPTDKTQVVSTVMNYKQGKLDGEYIEYFNNGTIKAKGSYVNDKKDGIWVRYHVTGKKMVEERYRNGLKYGWSYAFNEGGKEIGKQFFWEGKAYSGKALDIKLAELKRKGIDPNQ